MLGVLTRKTAATFALVYISTRLFVSMAWRSSGRNNRDLVDNLRGEYKLRLSELLYTHTMGKVTRITSQNYNWTHTLCLATLTTNGAVCRMVLVLGTSHQQWKSAVEEIQFFLKNKFKDFTLERPIYLHPSARIPMSQTCFIYMLTGCRKKGIIEIIPPCSIIPPCLKQVSLCLINTHIPSHPCHNAKDGRILLQFQTETGARGHSLGSPPEKVLLWCCHPKVFSVMRENFSFY
jgi:hypothetical protein